MATFKSLVSLTSKATLVFAILALVGLTQVSQTQGQSCSASLGDLNVCGPFVVPGTSNSNPSSQCCSALQSVDHDCLCNTLRIAARIPTRCNLPPLSCPANWRGRVIKE